MVHLHVFLTVKDPRDVDAVERLLLEHAAASRAEPGCRRFEVHRSRTDPRVFVLDEAYESQAAVDQHRAGRTFREVYLPRVVPLVERVAHECDPIAC